MTQEEIDSLKAYKLELLKVLEKSQESFEKQLSYISAGGLGLSMVFIEKIVKNVNLSSCKWMLACSWILLGITLVANLISHALAARSTHKTLNEIEANHFNYSKASKRIQHTNYLNYGCILSLLVGILLLIFFVTVNLYSMNQNINEVEHPKPQTGQVPPPPPVVRPVQPSTKNN